MAHPYESIQKILFIKQRRCDKANREQSKQKDNLEKKKEDISSLETQLERHNQFTINQTDKLWGEMLGKSVSIKDIDKVRRNIDKLKQQAINIAEEIAEEKNILQRITQEFLDAKKNISRWPGSLKNLKRLAINSNMNF